MIPGKQEWWILWCYGPWMACLCRLQAQMQGGHSWSRAEGEGHRNTIPDSAAEPQFQLPASSPKVPYFLRALDPSIPERWAEKWVGGGREDGFHVLK